MIVFFWFPLIRDSRNDTKHDDDSMTYAYAHAHAQLALCTFLRPPFGGHDVKMYYKISLPALRWIHALPLSPNELIVVFLFACHLRDKSIGKRSIRSCIVNVV
jgi:hypothetical protein